MAEVEQELLSALQALDKSPAEQPCGCQETSGAAGSELDVFASDELSYSTDLVAELDSALSLISSESGSEFASLEGLSVEEELEFASLEEGTKLSLEDILQIAERYPGLKITFSY